MARTAVVNDITQVVAQYRNEYGNPDAVTREYVGSDMSYRKFVTNVRDAEKFNYHSDYWGYDEEYQEANVNFMKMLNPYINKVVILDGVKCKVLGMLIDRQYNSLSHTDILVEII